MHTKHQLDFLIHWNSCISQDLVLATSRHHCNVQLSRPRWYANCFSMTTTQLRLAESHVWIHLKHDNVVLHSAAVIHSTYRQMHLTTSVFNDSKHCNVQTKENKLLHCWCLIPASLSNRLPYYAQSLTSSTFGINATLWDNSDHTQYEPQLLLSSQMTFHIIYKDSYAQKATFLLNVTLQCTCCLYTFHTKLLLSYLDQKWPQTIMVAKTKPQIFSPFFLKSRTHFIFPRLLSVFFLLQINIKGFSQLCSVYLRNHPTFNENM